MTQPINHPTDWPFSEPSRPVPSGPVTYEEFLDWCDEDTHAEWVDGEIILMSPANIRHHLLMRFLVMLFQEVAEHFGLGEVFPAGIQMRLSGRVRSGREPDVIFVRREDLDRVTLAYLDGPGDLVVEIVSPESFTRDHEDKVREYEAGGVPEYWLLNPMRKWLDVLRLGADGQYQVVFAGHAGMYESPALPGLRLDVEWLWQDPLPRVFDLLGLLGLR